MALFNKFFFSSNKKKNNSTINQNNYSPHFPFDSKQIRILLYRECDASGRRLLFDSNSIQKVDINDQQNVKLNQQSNKTKLLGNLNNKQTIKSDNFLNDGNFIEISNGIGYKHIRPTSSDITNIGEMVFGALAMSFRSPSLKVHWLQAPSRLLCSQVFLSPIPGTNTGCLLNQRDLLGNASNSDNKLNSKHNLKKGTNESFDGYSVSSLTARYSPNEFNRNLSMQLSTLPLIKDNLIQNTLNLQSDQIGINKINAQLNEDITPNTIGSDSGYATISDCWTSRSSYQYSTRSSMGSVLSDPLSTYDSLRKFSLDSGKSNCGDCGTINNRFGCSFFSTSMQQNSKASDININRRISRNIQTSFENQSSICDLVGFICDNYQIDTVSGGSEGCVATKCNMSKTSNTNEIHSSPELRSKDTSSFNSIYNLFEVPSRSNLCKSHKINSKRSKLGLAVCISMTETHEKEMEEFCCEHIALLESMLSRLRTSAEYAYLNHKRFLKIMLHAWKKTVEWISDFFTVPRLKIPLWHSLTSAENKTPKHITDNFVKEFTFLLKTLDSKDTNFFISTMITTVLTYHLGWVASIMTTSASTNFNLRTTPEILNEKQNSLKNLADQYPYNPLWAQMCDLYGAIGSPPKVTRTIISGKDKNLIEKFLHVLTYFIRCSEVRRNDVKRKFDIDSANEVLIEKQAKTTDNLEKSKNASGFNRKSTQYKNLCEISSIGNESNIKNDTKNILPSQELKFLKKSLRLNNFGSILEKNVTHKDSESHDKIKLTVTTPEDVEMPLDDTFINCCVNNISITDEGEALEAIEIQESVELNAIHNVELPNSLKTLNFWKLKPTVKEGIRWTEVEKSHKTIKVKEGYYEVTNKNSLRISAKNNEERYGSFKIKENESTTTSQNLLNEKKDVELKEIRCSYKENNFETSQKLEEKQDSVNLEDKIENHEKNKGVLFVLGENEHLVNIKKTSENIEIEFQKPKNKSAIGNYNKKNSGVKFNLEEYSESVNKFLNKQTSLEKSRYIVQSQITRAEKPLNYDFWTKCTCDTNNHATSTSSTFDLNKNKSQNDLKNPKTISNACEFCKTNNEQAGKINDKSVYVSSYGEKKNSSGKIKTSGGSRKNSGVSPVKKIELKDENIRCLPISSRGSHLKKMFQNIKEKSKKMESLDIKILPMPQIDNSDGIFNSSHMNKSNNFKTGFIPSLFVGVTDRYIPDMVLQGTLSPFEMWETNIKNDLVIASHCASLISLPTENVAIIADMDKWEIKILSSQQNNNLPYASSLNGSVGISQLVSQLLEGFYILGNSGISSYECFIYLESKLKEIYLHSEALAGLLLTKEFCSLNSVTTALNLSENDVPLLLAIASIHSPQVTKRYGISFG